MQEYVDFAEKMVIASSEVILKYWQNQNTIENKTDGSPVTIADREAEQVMREMITNAYPEHGIIGEEFGYHQSDADYQWVLDPIDGTVNFIAGSFLFGTLIALLHEGRPILGVIHHPISQQVLIGVHGITTLNGKPVNVRSCSLIEAATASCSSHYSIAQHYDFDAYQQLVSRCRTYRTWGDCHGYFLLATGGVDIMLDGSMNIWDIAALIPVVEGAGGKITDWSGGDPLSGKGIIATGGSIHDEIIRVLNPSMVNTNKTIP